MVANSGRFLDADPIEDYLSTRVEDMTEWELVSYLQNAIKALFGITLVAHGHAERAIFIRLATTYGKADAARIVKWVVWRHFCRDNVGGNFVQFTSFASGRKWWTDLMYSEMQAQVLRETTPVVQSSATTAWI